MMYTIRVSDGVDTVLAKWKKSNPNLFKKYKKIYKELLEHPKTGLGHPEALRGGGDITWSRHITAHDRIIYDIYAPELSATFSIVCSWIILVLR